MNSLAEAVVCRVSHGCLTSRESGVHVWRESGGRWSPDEVLIAARALGAGHSRGGGGNTHMPAFSLPLTAQVAAPRAFCARKVTQSYTTHTSDPDRVRQRGVVGPSRDQLRMRGNPVPTASRKRVTSTTHDHARDVTFVTQAILNDLNGSGLSLHTLVYGRRDVVVPT